MRRLVVLLIALTAIVGTDVAASAAPSPDHVQRGNDPHGKVLDGLVPTAADSPCQGKFQLVHQDRKNGVDKVLCTHGPDPAPDGVDVREQRGPEPGAPAAAVLPTGGVSTATPGVQCYGSGSDGYRVQVIYAHASDVADRFATYAPSFATWAANVDLMLNASAAETGGSRYVRWLTDPACNLVIDRVTLSATGDDNFSNTVSELRAKGYTRTDRKYLVWVDANVYCGIAQVYYDDSASTTPGANASNGHPQVQGEVARVDNGCWGQSASVEAHELMHNLGGVQTSAPHSTSYNHCWDEYDRMCYADGSGQPMSYICPSTHENRFDCNHDDYFSTAAPAGSYLATHWNTANSVFLSAVPGTTPGPTTTTTTTPTTTTTTTTLPPTTTTTRPPTTTTVPPTTTTVPPTTTTVPPTTTTVPPTTTTVPPPPPATKPSAPRSLTYNQPANGTVVLSWQPPTAGPVTGYKIYRSTMFGTATLVATVGNVTSFTNTGVTATLLSYYVTAYNAAGESVASNRIYFFAR